MTPTLFPHKQRGRHPIRLDGVELAPTLARCAKAGGGLVLAGDVDAGVRKAVRAKFSPAT
jgi:hypothetical protein